MLLQVERATYSAASFSVAPGLAPLLLKIDSAAQGGEEVRGERTKSGAEIMTSQDGCRCEL